MSTIPPYTTSTPNAAPAEPSSPSIRTRTQKSNHIKPSPPPTSYRNGPINSKGWLQNHRDLAIHATTQHHSRKHDIQRGITMAQQNARKRPTPCRSDTGRRPPSNSLSQTPLTQSGASPLLHLHMPKAPRRLLHIHLYTHKLPTRSLAPPPARTHMRHHLGQRIHISKKHHI